MSPPIIQSLDVTSTDAEIGDILEKDGCVIINNAMDHASIDDFLCDLEDHIDNKPTGTGNFTGFQTKRLHSLFAKMHTLFLQKTNICGRPL